MIGRGKEGTGGGGVGDEESGDRQDWGGRGREWG